MTKFDPISQPKFRIDFQLFLNLGTAGLISELLVHSGSDFSTPCSGVLRAGQIRESFRCTVIYTDENFVMDKNIDINIEIHFDNDNSNATDNNYNSGNDNNNITNKNNNKMTMLVILCLSIIIHCKKQWKWAAFANLAMVYIQWSQCKIMKVFPFPRCQIFACDL